MIYWILKWCLAVVNSMSVLIDLMLSKNHSSCEMSLLLIPYVYVGYMLAAFAEIS